MTPDQEKMARSSLTKIARWGIAHEHSIHYTEDERRDDWLKKPIYTLPIWTDCSGFVTLCYKWAGLPDPNGLGYKTLGYTGTLLDHCHEIAPKHAKPGDIPVYGPDTGDHTAIIVGAYEDGSIKVVSHGQESGPEYQPNYVESRYHRPPTRIMRSPAFA